MNKYSDRGGEVEVRTGSKIFSSEGWDIVHQTVSANHSVIMFEVCGRLAPVLSRCNGVQTVPDSFLCRQEKLW